MPLQAGGTRAFGELWVDNDEKERGNNGNGEGIAKRYHLFLTFDIETIGRFEVNIASSDNDVNIAVMHPKSFVDKVPAIQRKVTRIAANAGYNTKTFQTAVLDRPHNLMQVFPDIMERRKGFNVLV
ncbi:hypothetical protein FACS189499_10400 [Clostridia bacterium]|nr:hypothetical protein FACS189499_10400 [Clostridia bacterium]